MDTIRLTLMIHLHLGGGIVRQYPFCNYGICFILQTDKLCGSLSVSNQCSDVYIQ